MEVTDKDGIMTKDIALAIHGKDTRRGGWAVTDVCMDVANVSESGSRARVESNASPQDKLKNKLAAKASTKNVV